MSVQPWVNGPAFISVALGGGSLQFFGTAAYVPKPRIMRAHKPLPNDVAGHILPFDNSYQGQKAMIVMAMSRFDWGMYIKMAETTQGGDPGIDNFGSRGS